MRWSPSDDPSFAPVGDLVEGSMPCGECSATGHLIRRPHPRSRARTYELCSECGGRKRLRVWWLILPDGPEILTTTKET